MMLTAFRTRMGWIALLADDNALLAMTLPQRSRQSALDQLREDFSCDLPTGTTELLRRTRKRLERYFAGERVSFENLPFHAPRATEFQRRVWQLTRAIPYGSTVTYHSLARAAERPNAARAIGQCMARNPLPIIVPCHRVVGTSGDLRGFGGGLAMKRTLLRMEGALP